MCPSRSTPSNLIFKLATPFVFQSDHGRLVSLWAPALVCSRREVFRGAFS